MHIPPPKSEMGEQCMSRNTERAGSIRIRVFIQPPLGCYASCIQRFAVDPFSSTSPIKRLQFRFIEVNICLISRGKFEALLIVRYYCQAPFLLEGSIYRFDVQRVSTVNDKNLLHSIFYGLIWENNVKCRSVWETVRNYMAREKVGAFQWILMQDILILKILPNY